jgi:MFS superfamily sulfate permease-like transporter
MFAPICSRRSSSASSPCPCRWRSVGVAGVTVALLVLLPRVLRVIPTPLVALASGAVGVMLMARFAPQSWHFHALTIGDRFSYPLGHGIQGHGIAPLPPMPVWPWRESAGFTFDYHTIRELLPSAFARNMSESRHFIRLTRIAPRHDVLVMLTCFVLTVAFDMVIAVSVGVVLAALLFMRRMSVLTNVQLETASSLDVDVPVGVRVYELAGPLFFGAAKSAMEVLHQVGDDQDHTYILDMQHVPTMDATGLVALESVLDRLRRSKIKVIFSGLAADVSAMLERAGIKREPGTIAYAPDVETAISMAIVHAARAPDATQPAT